MDNFFTIERSERTWTEKHLITYIFIIVASLAFIIGAFVVPYRKESTAHEYSKKRKI